MRIAVAVLAVGLGSLAPAQWRSGPIASAPTSNGPACEYHLATGTLVLFGGRLGLNGTDDFWVHDGAQWTAPPGARPPARNGAAMASDPFRGVVVMHGGATGLFGQVLADTWQWDGRVWTQTDRGRTGPSLFDHALCFDTWRNRAVAFGGMSTLSNASTATWEFDGLVWREIPTAQHPPSTRLTAMAFHQGTGKVIAFGGANASGQLFQETWRYDGAQWSAVTAPAAPVARSSARLVYDWRRDVCVLFGGSTSVFTYPDETWTFDGAVWTEDSRVPRPPGRAQFAMTYDLLRDVVVVHGGHRNQVPRNDTWTYGGWTETFGPGCAGSNGVPRWDVAAAPHRGQPFAATLRDLAPGAPAIATVGFDTVTSALGPLPLDLTPFGLTGCTLAASIDQLLPMVQLGDRARATLQVPDDAALVGFRFALTGVVVDPVNPFGAVLSPPLSCLIGH
ncbi:MAG: hypothetical protein AB7O97_06875 [Planctomycetota bacterium]